MIEYIDRLRDLQFGQLMAVYEEGNRENGEERYPHLSSEQQLLAAEQDFYRFLESFLKEADTFLMVLSHGGKYISALRMEPYEDGLLLEALETVPEMRNRGYASELVKYALEYASLASKAVYSHVSKKNIPSLIVHKKCGFQRIKEYAVYIDGSVNQKACTLRYSL